MDEARPQFRIVHERLGRIAEDRLDLRTHVRQPAAIRHRGVGDVDVHRGRHLLHEYLVARVGLCPLLEGDLERVLVAARGVQEAAAFMDQERLAKTGHDDDHERRHVLEADIVGGPAPLHEEECADEHGRERQGAERDGRQSPEVATESCGRRGRTPGTVDRVVQERASVHCPERYRFDRVRHYHRFAPWGLTQLG